MVHATVSTNVAIDVPPFMEDPTLKVRASITVIAQMLATPNPVMLVLMTTSNTS